MLSGKSFDRPVYLYLLGILQPRDILVIKSIDRHHIFTHIRWDMRGWFLEVDAPAGGFTWLTLDEIDTEAALPTAFRQFREEV